MMYCNAGGRKVKTLVGYDSTWGNTEKIAQAVAAALPESKAVRSKNADVAEIASADLIVLGAPTNGGRPTQDMQKFLQKLTKSNVSGKKTASFDTRLSTKWVGIFGYAAGKIAKHLQKQGANLVADPEAFFVTGTQGPLKNGEEERAAAWAKGLAGK